MVDIAGADIAAEGTVEVDIVEVGIVDTVGGTVAVGIVGVDIAVGTAVEVADIGVVVPD